MVDAPVVYSRKHKQDVPLPLAYQDVMDYINQEGQEAYKEELLGIDVIERANLKYWIGQIILENGYTYEEFTSQSLHSQARMIAAQFHKNMVAVITQHRKVMADRIRDALKGNANKN